MNSNCMRRVMEHTFALWLGAFSISSVAVVLDGGWGSPISVTCRKLLSPNSIDVVSQVIIIDINQSNKKSL